ncbi:hypothetical protein F5876DRAFT_62719 [Lentinula aff. lateritia]|uniref:Uncharacterized protein n=1 Tax=Lentinula aff. lateritia TaxID=2804960 RepID=A0ACC1UA26_9AGAR|nr:hypothetical protein F5876DRAFT_62719 [Lentinula aff. lateritia]
MRTSESISFSFSLAFSLVLILILMAKATHAVPASVRRTINSEYTEMRKIVLGAPGGKRNPDWILGFYGDDVYLNEDDRKVFDKKLDLTVGRCRDDCSGAFSKGIYSLLKDHKAGGIKHGKNTVIIKVMLEIGNNAWGEVKALKDAGLYVDSGLANVIGGVMMDKTIEYKNAKLDQSDFNPANFLVGGTQTSKGLVLKTPMTEAQLVDWGYPGVFKVKNGITEAEVNAIAIAQNEYPELRSIPSHCIQLKITVQLPDGTSQVVRLTQSGFQETLAQYEPLKLVTIQVLPTGEPPDYSKKVLGY